jgi:hypothetical protein
MGIDGAATREWFRWGWEVDVVAGADFLVLYLRVSLSMRSFKTDCSFLVVLVLRPAPSEEASRYVTCSADGRFPSNITASELVKVICNLN